MVRIKVLLPAYNEEDSLKPLLERIEDVKNTFKLDLEVLVVNDGSSDSTLKVASQPYGNLKVVVYDQQPNQGLAEAMRRGIAEGLKDLSDDDLLISMDADNSHPPELIYRMFIHSREGNELIIASRYRYGSQIVGLAPLRKFLSSGAGLIFRTLIRVNGVRDYTCGYRAYKASLLKKAIAYYGTGFIEQKGFGCMAEILVKLKRFKPIVYELPFILRYDQKQGQSKMNLIKTIRQTIVLVLKNSFR